MQGLLEGWVREAVESRTRVWTKAKHLLTKPPAECVRCICQPNKDEHATKIAELSGISLLDKRRLVEFLVLRGISKNRFVWEMCFQYLDFDGDGVISEQDFKLAFWGPDGSQTEAPNFSKSNTERQLSARGTPSANRYDKLKIPMQLEKSPLRDQNLETTRELSDIDEVFRTVLISELVRVECIKIQLYNTPGFTLDKAFNYLSANNNLATQDRLKEVCGFTVENLESKTEFFICSVKRTLQISKTDGIKIREFRNAISPVCFSLEDLNWHQPVIQPTDSMVDYFDLAVNKYHSAHQSSIKSELYNSKEVQEIVSKSNLRSDGQAGNSNLMFSFQDELRVVRGTSPSRRPQAFDSPDYEADEDGYIEYQYHNSGQPNIQIGDFSLGEEYSNQQVLKKQSPPRPKIPVPSLSQLTSPFNISKLQYSSQASSQLQAQQDANQTWNVWPPLLSDRAGTGEVPTERLFQNSSEEQQDAFFSVEGGERTGLLASVLVDEASSPRMPTVRKTLAVAGGSAGTGVESIRTGNIQLRVEGIAGSSGRSRDVTPPTSTERILRVKSGHSKTAELELSLTEQQRVSATPGGASAWRDEYQRKKTQPSGVSWLTGFADNILVPESEKRSAAVKEFSTRKGNTLITTQIIPKTTSTGLADTQNISSGYQHSNKHHLFSSKSGEHHSSCNWQSSSSRSGERLYENTPSNKQSEITSTPRRYERDSNTRHFKGYFDQIEISQHKNSRHQATGNKSPIREFANTFRNDTLSFGNTRAQGSQEKLAAPREDRPSSRQYTRRELSARYRQQDDPQDKPSDRPMFAYSSVRAPRYLE